MKWSLPDDVTPLGDGGLGFVDVLPGASREALAQLSSIHIEHFGDLYAEATQDFQRAWSGGSAAARIIEHQWLLVLNGVPCGELVFATNLARRTVSRHFTSVRKEFRPLMPDRWIPSITRAVSDFCISEASAQGVELLGMMSEITPKHAAGWRKFGLYQPDIGFSEPLHGNYWRDFGELQFAPMLANILPFPPGRAAGLGVIAEAGVRAFLLDYYTIPETDPTFLGIIDRCRSLPPAW